MYRVKKLIVDWDSPQSSVYKYRRQTFIINEEMDFPYFAGSLKVLFPPTMKLDLVEKYYKDNELFNAQGLAKIILPIGSMGLYYLILRPKFKIDKLFVEPDHVVVDIYYGENNNLIYSFYNPTQQSSIAITASIKKDDKGIYSKLKSNPTDIYWRQYFVRVALNNADTVLSPPDKTPEIMSIDEVARYLNLKSQTIRNWTSQRKIPSVKIGGSVRYKKLEIDKWLEQKNKSRKKIKTFNKFVPNLCHHLSYRQVFVGSSISFSRSM